MKTPSKTFVQNHVNNGGGNKLITRKQIFFIESLAHALGKTGQGLALETYQKSIAELLGSEAHEMIQTLSAEITERGLEVKPIKRKRYVERK